MAIIDPDENARKKGSAELLVLAQLEARPRHGYEIGVEIERRSEGAVAFQIASLYPVFYRLEKKGLISGQWVEAAGQRRRRYYKLTRAGPHWVGPEPVSIAAYDRQAEARSQPHTGAGQH
jgi:PadR family transcriptional regulator PadR